MYPFVRSGSFAVGVVLAAAMLSSCGGAPSSFSPSGASASGEPIGITELSKTQDAALTMPHFVNGPVHRDHGKSFMDVAADKKSALLYVGSWSS